MGFHLFLVLSAGGIQRLDESSGVADEHGVAGGTYDHAQHSEPHIGHALGGLGPVADTQHVAHGFEQCIGVLHPPGVILWVGARQRRWDKTCQKRR